MSGYVSEWEMTAGGRRAGRVFIGGICEDQFLTLSRFERGRKNPVQRRFVTAGGGAANVARVQRRLAPEAAVTLLAPVGDDREGLELRRQMAEQRISMPWPAVVGGATSVSVVISCAGEGTICGVEGVRAAAVPAGLLEAALARAAGCWLVAPGGNEPIGLATRAAARRGIPVFFGLGRTQIEGLGAAGLRAALAGPVELMICNRPEAARLTGRDGVLEALEAMRRLGRVRYAVITDGAAGLSGLSDEGLVQVNAYRDGREVVDDVGAGDAAHAAISHCLLEGMGFGEALRAGARLGFEACTARGAATALVGSEELREFALAVPA